MEDYDVSNDDAFDVVVVGAGFAGVYGAYRFRQAGLRTVVLEAGGDVGGTWYWNRYPGARCDVESMEYSYSFSEELQQEWEWTERFAGQPEIQRYIAHVADRFDLRRDIRMNTRVTAARWEESDGRWRVHTDSGKTLTGQFLVMATGPLSTAAIPDIPGLDHFNGPILHTGQWPQEEPDFAGLRVAVIGTGSSGIQLIPLVAEVAETLTVFQRTASYTVPAHNRPMDPDEASKIKADYAGFRHRQRRMLGALGADLPGPHVPVMSLSPEDARRAAETAWQHGGFSVSTAFADTMLDPRANEFLADFVRAKIRGIVRDPETAERLSPRQLISCKRLSIDTGYYQTYNRPNVHLVDIGSNPVRRITSDGLIAGSEHYRLDALIMATGFDAMTGSLMRIDIAGAEGVTLQDQWTAGPVSYLGLAVPRFPNMFIVSGPGSPSVLINMVVSAEHHIDWIADAIAHLRGTGRRTVEAQHDAANDWVAHVNAVAGKTLFPSCNSWYLGANVPGKPRVFMPLLGFPPYAQKCARVAESGYPGFTLK
jgi:cation diffusion facilitator CzcD-associated flavoprotein CzcO